tara:strand:- start:312 stop:659 length:348 start_codon:yes stop_codon:yes gene_type:complete
MNKTEQEYLILADDCKTRIEEKNEKIKKLINLTSTLSKNLCKIETITDKLEYIHDLNSKSSCNKNIVLNHEIDHLINEIHLYCYKVNLDNIIRHDETDSEEEELTRQTIALLSED